MIEHTLDPPRTVLSRDPEPSKDGGPSQTASAEHARMQARQMRALMHARAENFGQIDLSCFFPSDSTATFSPSLPPRLCLSPSQPGEVTPRVQCDTVLSPPTLCITPLPPAGPVLSRHPARLSSSSAGVKTSRGAGNFPSTHSFRLMHLQLCSSSYFLFLYLQELRRVQYFLLYSQKK